MQQHDCSQEFAGSYPQQRLNGLLFALLITNGAYKMDKKLALAYLDSTSIPACELPPELQDAPMADVKAWLTTQAYPAGATSEKTN